MRSLIFSIRNRPQGNINDDNRHWQWPTEFLINSVAQVGFEPTTFGLPVHCFTKFAAKPWGTAEWIPIFLAHDIHVTSSKFEIRFHLDGISVSILDYNHPQGNINDDNRHNFLSGHNLRCRSIQNFLTVRPTNTFRHTQSNSNLFAFLLNVIQWTRLSN